MYEAKEAALCALQADGPAVVQSTQSKALLEVVTAADTDDVGSESHGKLGVPGGIFVQGDTMCDVLCPVQGQVSEADATADLKHLRDCEESVKDHANEFNVGEDHEISHIPSPSFASFALLTENSPSLTVKIPMKPAGDIEPVAVSRVRSLLKRRESWMPKTQHVKYLQNSSTTSTAVWGSEMGQYIACGEGPSVMIYDLTTMASKCCFACDAIVNTITGSIDGSVLVYGLKSGSVVFRDMNDEGRILETVPQRNGKVFALWLSPDGWS